MDLGKGVAEPDLSMLRGPARYGKGAAVEAFYN